MLRKHFFIAIFLFSFFLIAQDEAPKVDKTQAYEKELEELGKKHNQKIQELEKKYDIPPYGPGGMIGGNFPSGQLANNLFAFSQYSEELGLQEQFEKEEISYDELVQKTKNLAQRFEVEYYLPPAPPEKELRKFIPLTREGRKLGEEFQNNVEKLQRKYGIQNSMQQMSSQMPDRNIHGLFYKGLKLPEGEGKIPSADQLTYKRDISNDWQKTISRVHKKDERLQFVTNVTRWSGASENDSTFPLILPGGIELIAVSPAVRQFKTPLNPALVKVFSEPEKYLTPEWNTSMIGEILIVPKGITQNAPFPIPSAQRMPQFPKQKEKGELPQYRFFLPEGLEEKDIIALMKQLQNDVSVKEGKITEAAAIRRAQLLEEALRDGEPNTTILASCPATNIEERADVDVDSLIAKLKEETDRSKRQEILNQLINIGSNDVIEKLKMLFFTSEDPNLQKEAFFALNDILYRKDPAQYLDFIENERVIKNPYLLSDPTFSFNGLGWMYNSKPELRGRISRTLLNYLNNENRQIRLLAIEGLIETQDRQLIQAALQEAASLLTQKEKEEEERDWMERSETDRMKNDLVNDLLFKVHLYIQQSQWMPEANERHIDSMLKIITDPQNIQFLGLNTPTVLSIIGYVKEHPSLSHYAAPLQEHLDKMKSPDYRWQSNQ